MKSVTFDAQILISSLFEPDVITQVYFSWNLAKIHQAAKLQSFP